MCAAAAYVAAEYAAVAHVAACVAARVVPRVAAWAWWVGAEVAAVALGVSQSVAIGRVPDSPTDTGMLHVNMKMRR